MAYLLLLIIAIGLLLIATELVNRINRAAVAMFMGVMCWLLYIAHGTSFVLAQHPIDFFAYISANGVNVNSVKEYIASNIFLKYVAQCADIVLFLMATTTIVEVLNNNGCFDFIQRRLRYLPTSRFLWFTTLTTFALSANIDNLTTTILILSIVHPLLKESRCKRVITTNIVTAACTGGSITVIGDMTTLKLWNDGMVTPTIYFLMIVCPILVFQTFVSAALCKSLPNRLPYSDTLPAYHGDDSLIKNWQKFILLVVGIGGLWFIPTFHRITLLPPFLGGLCVLAFIWAINEVFNRPLMSSDKMVRKRVPIALQYANMQNLLFFIGLTLMFGALSETGLFTTARSFLNSHNIGLCTIGISTTLLSALFGSLSTLIASADLFTTSPVHEAFTKPELFICDGSFWPLLIYSVTTGGLVFATSSIAGTIMARAGHITFKWYLIHVTPKVIIGYLLGFLCLCSEIYFILPNL